MRFPLFLATGRGGSRIQPRPTGAGFSDHSLRQVVRLSAGGPQARIRISNVYGASPLHLTGATIGKAGQGAAVQPGTLHRLRFQHAWSTTVPAGRETFSDGVGASRDANNRWPDEPAERLAAAHRPIGVLNAGLVGKRPCQRSA